MNINVRAITEEDYLQTIEVIKRSIIESLGKVYPQKLIDEFCKKYSIENFKKKAQEIKYFVAEDSTNHQVLGVIGLKNNQLRSYFVEPKQQGKGIGRKLYDYLERSVRKNKIKELILEGSPLGQPIYEHLGFKKIKIVEKERVGIKYADALMRKTLK